MDVGRMPGAWLGNQILQASQAEGFVAAVGYSYSGRHAPVRNLGIRSTCTLWAVKQAN